jgi:hypothetical protein
MVIRTYDPHADFERYDAKRERDIAKLPVCECCGEPIQTEDLFDFENGYLVCEECVLDFINEKYRNKTEEYVED